MDDVFSYCRGLRLKHFFASSGSEANHADDKPTPTPMPSATTDEERCEMKSKYKNPYFCPSANYTAPNLEKYIATTKSGVQKLMEKPANAASNLSSSERATLDSLTKRTDMVVTKADKGRKVIVMDKEYYVTNCETQLNNKEFYEKIDDDPTETIADDIETEVYKMLEKEQIDKRESQVIMEHLDKPRLPVFYGLPKIHKTFKDFPPLRPIVSGFNSCTARLSEYLDTFLKFQAKKCKSYLRDTTDFLSKLEDIKSLPENAILVTMDVASLYTNIDHEEGAQACFENLKKRRNKKIPSTLLKKLISLVLKSNVFRFNNTLYKQIKGTAMGTPMAVNYANIFLDKLETEMLKEYESKTNLKPFVWMRYIDDIFLIWTHDEQSLTDFLKYCDEYSTSKNMKSKIRYESNCSAESVNFLDVKVKITGNKIQTSLYSKPTDAHLYLNAKSCHPDHVVKNIPKGQFIRVRRICSEDEDFDLHANRMKNYFLSRGYNEKHLDRAKVAVRRMKRTDLLNKIKEPARGDPHSIMVCTWHPKLRKLPSILNKNYTILENDAKLCTLFKDQPTVAFRRKKNLGSILCKNDIKKNDEKECSAKPCKCQLCKIMKKDTDHITNHQNGLTLRIQPGATCKSKGVVYAIHCKKCQLLYIGHSGNDMSVRWGQHKHDIKKRPDQNELATHCHNHHNIDQDIEIYILAHGIHNDQERERLEDKLICKLQTMGKHGLNEKINPYAKEMYTTWTAVLLKN